MNIGPLVAIVPVVLAVAMIILIIRRNITGRSESISRDITAAIPAIVILMVAALLIGSFASDVDHREYELYECVPLSSFGSGATIEGDCVETVTIGDTDYVRMTDLGTFTVTIGDSTKEHTVTKAHMDLVLMTGQSNSYYYTNPTYYESASPVAPGMAFFFGTDQPSGRFAGIPRQDVEGSLDSATITDVVADDGSVNIAAMYPEFCSDYVKETGHRVIVVNTGISGEGIAAWDDGGECDVWMEDVLGRFSEVASGSAVLTPTAVLWIQGESDYENTEAYYKERFEGLVDRFEDGTWGYSFPRVLTSLPRYPNVDVEIPPALAQQSVAQSDRTVRVASSIAVEFGPDASQYTMDGIHYNQTVHDWLGEAFAREYAKSIGVRPVSETIVMVGTIGPTVGPKVPAYGTSGKAYSLSASWTLDGNVYTGVLSGNPPGTTIADGLEAVVSKFTYDAGSLTLTVNLDPDSTFAWGDAVNATSLVIGPGVSSLPAGAFAGFSSLEHICIQGHLSSVGAGALPSMRDYAGVATSPVKGEYAKAADGVFCLCDPTIFAYSENGKFITGLASGVSGARYLVIPSINYGHEVTEVSSTAFNGNTDLKAVLVLPDTRLVKIAAQAFNSCTSLEEAMLEHVEEINGSGFAYCPLKSVSLDSIEAIGARAFRGCSAVTEVSFGSSLATLDAAAFPSWTFYASDGTTVIDKTVASNLAGHAFAGTASALVMQS